MTFATYQVDTVYALSVTLKLFSDYGFEVADTSYLQHQYLWLYIYFSKLLQGKKVTEPTT